MTSDLEDQYERTLLAWRRTALSLVATGLLVAHLAVVGTGRPALLVLLGGLGAVLGFVWLGRVRWVGATGLALVAGVVLLGALAVRGILG
ncbi:uncharacterized membrane protein YidH (DUF202 family) [Nocardioides sp. BE266]|uniref:DUF202 domain-containing protein n=1 Tax=Nocardioides sp. BE266 TaxID=2817725 RepID=UPI00286535D0|nr:DUF202 domain-containing protein [Nocardioides sp. BE266]MDR7251344.1 uncharacterized membrane protein YidH (DUF202 family) [Nocardioides sp. BE266]